MGIFWKVVLVKFALNEYSLTKELLYNSFIIDQGFRIYTLLAKRFAEKFFWCFISHTFFIKCNFYWKLLCVWTRETNLVAPNLTLIPWGIVILWGIFQLICKGLICKDFLTLFSNSILSHFYPRISKVCHILHYFTSFNISETKAMLVYRI